VFNPLVSFNVEATQKIRPNKPHQTLRRQTVDPVEQSKASGKQLLQTTEKERKLGATRTKTPNPSK
jgi:hypothetical protein